HQLIYQMPMTKPRGRWKSTRLQFQVKPGKLSVREEYSDDPEERRHSARNHVVVAAGERVAGSPPFALPCARNPPRRASAVTIARLGWVDSGLVFTQLNSLFANSVFTSRY